MNQPPALTMHVPPMYAIRCHRSRHARLVSNVLPSQGYTVWCHGCKSVELITWDQLPTEVLRAIMNELCSVLLARNEPGV